MGHAKTDMQQVGNKIQQTLAEKNMNKVKQLKSVAVDEVTDQPSEFQTIINPCE